MLKFDQYYLPLMFLCLYLWAYSYFNATPFSIAKSIMEVFMYHYPERLFRCYIVDAPWASRALWGLLTPFLDSVYIQLYFGYYILE